jgi:PAS domain S-box-containing protein
MPASKARIIAGGVESIFRFSQNTMPVATPANPPLRLLIITSKHGLLDGILAQFAQNRRPLQDQQVGTAAELRGELRRQAWDAVLYCHGAGALSPAAALKLIHDLGLDLPFIVLSAPADERAAIRAMKSGAHDVVALDRMERLIPAIEREIREARHRADHRVALEMIRESETRFRALASNLPGMVFHLQREAAGNFRFLFVSDGCYSLFGVKQHDLLASTRHFFDGLETADRRSLEMALGDSATGDRPLHWEGRLATRDKARWIDVSALPQRHDDGTIIWQGIVTDITATKDIEGELRASRKQLAELSFHLEAALEKERERIARDIHDELGSILVRLKIEATLLAGKLPTAPANLREKARSIELLLDQSLDTAQRVARQLRPGILKEFGLTEAIKCQTEDFAHSTGITCRAQCDDISIEVDSETSLALFRIAQEALTNIAKHAHASLVVVRLRREQGSIVLEIRDNGRGISEADMRKPKSFGLRGIRERVLGLSGVFEITAAEHGGTHVMLRLPARQLAETEVTEEDAQRNLF